MDYDRDRNNVITQTRRQRSPSGHYEFDQLEARKNFIQHGLLRLEQFVRFQPDVEHGRRQVMGNSST